MAPLRRMLLLAGKDLRTFVRDRMALLFSLAFPLLFVFGFSLLGLTGSEDPLLEVVVATEEEPGSLSAQIIDGMAQNASPSVRRLDPAEARVQVDAGDLPGYILFPAGFSEAVTSGEPTTLQVVADPDAADQRALLEGVAGAIAREVNERALTAGTAARLAGEAGSAVDPAQLAQALASVDEAAGPAPGTVTVRIEQVGEVKALEPGDALLPGYLTMFIFFAAGFGGQELIRERENHTLDRLIAGGVSGPTILAGKWLGTAGRAVVQAIVLWLAGVLLFSASFGRAPLGSILVTVAMIAASAALTLMAECLPLMPPRFSPRRSADRRRQTAARSRPFAACTRCETSSRALSCSCCSMRRWRRSTSRPCSSSMRSSASSHSTRRSKALAVGASRAVSLRWGAGAGRSPLASARAGSVLGSRAQPGSASRQASRAAASHPRRRAKSTKGRVTGASLVGAPGRRGTPPWPRAGSWGRRRGVAPRKPD
mgnify:CR=1 FL=1